MSMNKKKMKIVNKHEMGNVLIISILAVWIGFLCILKVPPLVYTICYFLNVLIVLLTFKKIYYICLYSIILLFNSFFLSTNSFYHIPISVNSITFIILLCCSAVTFFNAKNKISFKNNNNYMSSVPIFLWMLYSGGILLIKSNNISPLYFTVIMSYFLIAILMKNIVGRHKKNAELFLYTYFFGVMIIVVFWYIEIISGKTLFTISWTGEDRYRMGFLRAGSTVGDNNMACLIIGTALLFFQTQPFKKLIGGTVIKLVSSVMVIMLLFSFSRTAWLCLAVSIIFLILIRLKKIAILLLPLCILASNYFLGILSGLMSLDESSSSTRTLMNELSLTVWLDNFWTGLGWGNFAKYSIKVFGSDGIVAHITTMNTYYFVLVTGGIFAGLFLTTYIVSISKHALIHMFNLNPVYRYILAAIIYWAIFTFTLDTFDTVELWIMPTIITAIYKCEFQIED